jgi:hypothetical protein
MSMAEQTFSRKLMMIVSFVTVLFLQGCFSFFCKDDQIGEVMSPDQKRVATIFIRNCGATTDFATRVEVRWRSSERADDDSVFGVEGRPTVQVYWLDDKTLAVKCDQCDEAHIYRRVTKIGNVNIEFEK